MKKNINLEEEKYSKIDGLGRIHIPIEIRKKANIKEKDRFDIYKSEKNIILQKVKTDLQKDNIQNMNITLNNELKINIDVDKLNYNLENNCNLKGVVRIIDELGRIIIPVELRKELNILTNAEFKIYEKEDMIILVK